MCEDEIPVSVDEEKGKIFEEEKRIKKANGYEYKPLGL